MPEILIRVKWAGTLEELAYSADALLLDLDGVCFAGESAVPYAAQAIAEATARGVKPVFMTNNAMRAPQSVVKKLCSCGIAAEKTQVVTCAQVAAQVAKDRYGAGAKILVVGGEGVVQALLEAEIEPVYSADHNPVAVVQGIALDIGWSQLSEAALAISRGADYIATNIDSTLPTERGNCLGNGSLVAAVINATGMEPIYCGKPGSLIYERACKQANSTMPLCVGDRLDTDVAGAQEAGFAALHVLTGVHQVKNVLEAKGTARPRYIALDLRALQQAYPDIFYCEFSEDYNVEIEKELNYEWVKDDNNEKNFHPKSSCLWTDIKANKLSGKSGIAICGDYKAIWNCKGIFLQFRNETWQPIDTALATIDKKLPLNAYRALSFVIWRASDLEIIDPAMLADFSVVSYG